MFNRCRQTIENVIKRSKDRGNIENIPRKDRPKSLTLRNERRILKENRQNLHLSAPKLNEKLRGVLQGTVSNETIRRVLRANNIKAVWQEKGLLFLRSTGRSDYHLLNFIKPILSTFGELSYFVTKANLTFLVQMGDAWCGGSFKY